MTHPTDIDPIAALRRELQSARIVAAALTRALARHLLPDAEERPYHLVEAERLAPTEPAQPAPAQASPEPAAARPLPAGPWPCRCACAPAPTDEHDAAHLTPPEAATLRRLTDALVDELGTEWPRDILGWAAVATLFGLGRLIRQGHPVHAPGLGEFRRVLVHAPRTGHTGYQVEYTPEPIILEDSL